MQLTDPVAGPAVGQQGRTRGPRSGFVPPLQASRPCWSYGHSSSYAPSVGAALGGPPRVCLISGAKGGRGNASASGS